jgi:ABC-type transport system involved in cytochrome c biogenesis permease subunit
MLGFNVPDMLISSEAQISATGYCWLFIDFYYPRKRGEKHYRLLTILGLIIGAVLIIRGVCNIVLANLNVFTYLCLIIGIALIFINAKTGIS